MTFAEDDATRPLEFDLQRTRSLEVKWADGHASEYPLPLLRKSCPSATSRTARDEHNSSELVILKAVTNPEAMPAAE